MLFLLAVPILLAVAAVHRYLAIYAPSNLLIRHVRNSPPRLRTAGALAVVTSLLILALRAAEVGIAAGAPGWFNLIAFLVAWDAIKLGMLTLHTVARASLRSVNCRLHQKPLPADHSR